MTPEQLAKLLANSNPQDLSSELDGLDERELEAFSILAQGYSAGQIESEFGITRPELKSVKDRIRRKLQLKDEVALIRRIAEYARANSNL